MSQSGVETQAHKNRIEHGFKESVDSPEGPAEKLQGEVLLGEWIVVERLTRDAGDTGGSRSSCYRAVSREIGRASCRERVLRLV